MTKDEWMARELAKRPARDAAWRDETRRLWGFSSPVNVNAFGVEALAPTGTVDENRANVAA